MTDDSEQSPDEILTRLCEKLWDGMARFDARKDKSWHDIEEEHRDAVNAEAYIQHSRRRQNRFGP